MSLCLRRRFPPLGLHRGVLNSSYVLILLIHTKHKYKNMKAWTDPTSSFPWRRIHSLGRKGKKRVTNSRAAGLFFFFYSFFNVAIHIQIVTYTNPSPSVILAGAINTKTLTKNHPDSPHFHPDSPHYLPHSPDSHPHFLYSHPDYPHSHLDSPHSQHFHSHSPRSHPDFPRSHPDSPRSHHSPHSVPRFPIPAFTDSQNV